jgi:hypothetical protein
MDMLSPAGTSFAGTIRTGRALADGLKDLLKFEIRGAKAGGVDACMEYDLDVRYCMYRVACAQIVPFEIWTERTGNFSTYRGARGRPPGVKV